MDRVIAKPAFLKLKGATGSKYVNLANLKEVNFTANSVSFDFQTGPSVSIPGLNATELAAAETIIKDCSILDFTVITKGRS